MRMKCQDFDEYLINPPRSSAAPALGAAPERLNPPFVNNQIHVAVVGWCLCLNQAGICHGASGGTR